MTDQPSFELTTELAVRDGRAGLRVQGDVDIVTAPRLQAALAEAIGGAPDVVVDLHGVPFMDSTGLRVLLQAREEVLRRDGSIRLELAETGPVAHLLDLAGVRGLFGS